MPYRLLVVDDDREVCAVLRDILVDDYGVEVAYSGNEALKKVQCATPEMVLLDLRLPDLSGLDVLRILRQQRPEVGVVILTGWGSIASAVEATQLGAFDYLVKPIDFEQLKETVKHFFSLHPSFPTEVYERCGIIGNSPKMKKAWDLVQKFAPVDVTVLLRGESGTGKELFARGLHMLSKRQKGPFVPVECASLPETLVESELFGYEKGAFTGAAEKKPGRIEMAHRGTLFLDEIGDMSASMQAKLLRVIQEGEIQPLGSKSSRTVDVRIVAATNAPLEEAIEKGAFRADLYYRLSAATIVLPPLREREEDTSLLANYFASVYARRFNKHRCTLHPQTLEILQAFHWPGNVRELENVIKSAILLADKEISPGHLPNYVQAVPKPRPSGRGLQLSFDFDIDLSERLVWRKLKSAVSEQVSQRLFSKLLELSESNPKKLPQFLRIDPKTLRTNLRNCAEPANQPLHGFSLERKPGPLPDQAPELCLEDVFFERPERVRFENFRLGRTTFAGTNLRQLGFHNCHWPKKGRRVALYDELCPGSPDPETVRLLYTYCAKAWKFWWPNEDEMQAVRAGEIQARAGSLHARAMSGPKATCKAAWDESCRPSTAMGTRADRRGESEKRRRK